MEINLSFYPCKFAYKNLEILGEFYFMMNLR